MTKSPSLVKAGRDLAGILDQALVPADLRAIGWRYIDPPTKFSHEAWDYFLALIGTDEFKLLIYSAGTTPDGFKWKRGQFLISPQGMTNLADKERRARLRSATTKTEAGK